MRYDCSEDECDVWANLFGYDENNPWRFRFAIDSVSLSLNDISVILGDLQDNSAWQEFLKRMRIMPKPVSQRKTGFTAMVEESGFRCSRRLDCCSCNLGNLELSYAFCPTNGRA